MSLSHRYIVFVHISARLFVDLLSDFVEYFCWSVVGNYFVLFKNLKLKIININKLIFYYTYHQYINIFPFENK